MSDFDLAFILGRSIYLRPLTAEDHGRRYLSWLNDPDVSRYTQRRFRPTSETGWGSEKSSELLHLAICLNSDDQHVGNISLGPIHWPHRFAELRILLGDKSTWNGGVATEAIYLVTRHALVTLGLHRVEAGSANPAFTASVTKNLGWQEEGRRRERFFVDGTWEDLIMTAQLSEEFRTRAEYEPEDR